MFTGGPLRDHFVGNIEGRDIYRGACDVVVMEGFLGNVILKVSEGLFEFVMKMVAAEVVQGLPNDKIPAMHALQSLIHKHDYSAYGGARSWASTGFASFATDRAVSAPLRTP